MNKLLPEVSPVEMTETSALVRPECLPEWTFGTPKELVDDIVRLSMTRGHLMKLSKEGAEEAKADGQGEAKPEGEAKPDGEGENKRAHEEL